MVPALHRPQGSHIIVLGIEAQENQIWFWGEEESPWPGFFKSVRPLEPIASQTGLEYLNFAQKIENDLWLYLAKISQAPHGQKWTFPELMKRLPKERGRLAYVKAFQFLSDDSTIRVVIEER